MESSVKLRPATADDIPSMVEVELSAFNNSPLNARCFPTSSPVDDKRLEWMRVNIPDITLAVVSEAASPDSGGTGTTETVLGWVRWVRKPWTGDPGPRPVVTPDQYPADGDPELAARFFQANIDQSREIMHGRNHWFLSMLVVRKEAQRKGVGSALMAVGTEAADREGYDAYVNASIDGKGLYEKFGFRTVAENFFTKEIAVWHMRRDAKNV
ncbi:hypothetical protein N3K66_003808 [Trichothecium roseum]|uniref:Uncharacterized protein n=1 Tax=Trichothecium roseum TaxID=47278 RepID=A0ACC0V6F1_9HYPO|nr:hypothetical protein N3K66_003808 [Trichothecium roseum]